MQFVRSLTVDASLLRKLLRLWDDGGDPRNPFEHALVTPLFASPNLLKLVREELKEKRNSKIIFDSGGYYAQQGKIGFFELYGTLRDLYRDEANQWADWYVLPDHVPTAQDSVEAIEHKVRDTVTASKNLFFELPSHIRDRSIPVIHGHNDEQLRFCIENYVQLDTGFFGFGSFDTCGPNQSINRLTDASLDMLATIADYAQIYNFDLHFFGIGSPPTHYLFNQFKARSFDSLTWLKAAGYGHVFLPFVRGYRIGQRTIQRRYWEEGDFLLWKELTDHECPFCSSFAELTGNRLYRILHNLAVFIDTVERLDTWSSDRIEMIINESSHTYMRFLERQNGGLRLSRFA